MKVKDLIEKLQKYPGDMEVVIDGTFDPDADIDVYEMIVKKATFSTHTQYLLQKSYKMMCDDGELDGDYVDENVIMLC